MAGIFERFRNLLGGVESESTESQKAETLSRNIAERQIAEVMDLENAHAGRDDLWEGEFLQAIDFSVLAAEENGTISMTGLLLGSMWLPETLN